MPSLAATRLRSHLADFKSLPVLFVGSGLSRRYLRTPDWESLLAHFAEQVGRELAYYRGKTSKGLPGVASEIAHDLYERWWSDDKYAVSRSTYSQNIQKNSDPLKIEVVRYLEEFNTTDLDQSLKGELDILKKATIHAIITTNWDRLLETLFSEFESFIGQQHILFTETQGVGEIYKIHGSVEDPASLVLTAEDYKEFEEANPYILAKLLTLFVEHPVIFLGYRLADPHIQGILTRLLNCLSLENVKKLNERLIFVRWAPEDAWRIAPLLLEGRNINVIEYVASDFVELFNVLADLPRRFPVRLLRQLKREVYELALKEPPIGRIHVVDVNDDTRLDQVDVVIGVGTLARLGAKGYRVFTRQDLVLAMLNDDRTIDVNQLFKYVIPRVFASSKFTPIHFPLALDKATGGKRETRLDELPVRARALASGTVPLKPYFSAHGVEGRPFRDVLAEDPLRALHAGLACSFDTINDVKALRQFLLDRFQRSAPPSTELYKLACKYDIIKYKE